MISCNGSMYDGQNARHKWDDKDEIASVVIMQTKLGVNGSNIDLLTSAVNDLIKLANKQSLEIKALKEQIKK